MLRNYLLAALMGSPLFAQGYYIQADKPDAPTCPQLTLENDPRLTRGEVGARMDLTRTYRWGAQSIPVGERPDLSKVSFFDEKGKGRSIADLKGKIVVIGLWGYRCQPSARMLMEMAKAYKVKDRYGFEVWGMNYDANRISENATSLGGWPAIQHFLTANREALGDNPIPLGLPGVGDANPGHFLGVVDSLPVMMVVDRTGHLASVNIGYTQGMVGQRISQLLHEEQAAKAEAK